eukprot:COSAG02_NODE_4064_length_5842_cov_21.033780_2_plen_51_part_01
MRVRPAGRGERRRARALRRRGCGTQLVGQRRRRPPVEAAVAAVCDTLTFGV